MAGYSPGLAVFADDGGYVYVYIYIYIFVLKKAADAHNLALRNNHLVVTFPVARKQEEPIPNHLTLFLTLNCPPTLFNLKKKRQKSAPFLYMAIQHAAKASPLGHRALLLG